MSNESDQEPDQKPVVNEPFTRASEYDAASGVHDLLYRNVPPEYSFEQFYEDNAGWVQNTMAMQDALVANLDMMAGEVMTAAYNAGREDIADEVTRKLDEAFSQDTENEKFLTPDGYLLYLKGQLAINHDLADYLDSLANELSGAKTELYKEAETENSQIFGDMNATIDETIESLVNDGRLMQEARNETGGLSLPVNKV